MTKTLHEAREILTARNSVKLLKDGCKEPGTQVVTLRRNEYGHYIPCVSFIERVTQSGKISVSLWEDRSKQVTVTPDAVLWNPVT
jgi:hypothetical protein